MNAAAATGTAVRPASARTSMRSRRVLGQVGESDLQEIVDLLKSVCEVEIAVVGVQDEAAFHYLVAAGIEPVSHPVDISLCQHAMSTTGAFVINDTTADDRTRDNPFVDGRLAALALLRLRAGSTHPTAPWWAGRASTTPAPGLSPVQEQAPLTLGDSVSRILRLRLDRLDEAGRPAAPARPRDGRPGEPRPADAAHGPQRLSRAARRGHRGLRGPHRRACRSPTRAGRWTGCRAWSTG